MGRNRTMFVRRTMIEKEEKGESDAVSYLDV